MLVNFFYSHPITFNRLLKSPPARIVCVFFLAFLGNKYIVMPKYKGNWAL